MNGNGSLIVYAMESYGADLLQHTYTNVFRQLNTKYEQLTHPERALDDLHNNSSVAAAAKDHLRRYRRDDRDLDRDEESYFSENDGDDDMIDDMRTDGGEAPASSAAQTDEGPSGAARDRFEGSGRGPKITSSGGATGADHNGRDRDDSDSGGKNDDSTKAGAAPPLLGLIEYDSDEESPGKAEGED